jgi:hypothetical protein
MTTLEVLQEAIKSYNLWASKKGKEYDPVKSYPSLVGIMYNKLCSLIQEGPNPLRQSSKYLLGKYFDPSDLMCEFNKDSILMSLQIKCPLQYCNPERFNILTLLQEQTPHIAYEVSCEDACYQIRSSITNIENFKVQL